MMLRWPPWPDERRDRAKVNEAVRRLVELGLKVKK
jgi:hypothetical protein